MKQHITGLHCEELSRIVQDLLPLGTVQAKLVDKQQAVFVAWSHGHWEMWLMVSCQELIHCERIEVIAAHVANRIQATINRNSQLIQDS